MSAGVLEVTDAPRETAHRPMVGLLRSEWIKLATVRSTSWSLGLAVVLSVGVGMLASFETRSHWRPSDAIGFDATRTSLTGVFVAQLVIGVLGVLAMSAEYGTGTIRATFAAEPRRTRVLVAKVAVFAFVALAVSEVLAFVSYLVGQALLSAPAVHTTLSSPGALRSVAGSGAYLCLLGLLGLALATIIRHSAGAIGAFVGVLLVLPLLSAALPSSVGDSVRRFEPAQIGVAVISLHQGEHDLSPGIGLLVMLAYVVGLLAIGAYLLVRRDA